MTALTDIEKVYARWRDYDAPVKLLREALIAPLKKLGYDNAAEPSGKPILVLPLPDGRRLGTMNTQSFYFASQQTAGALGTGLLIRATATGRAPSHPRTRHSSEDARKYILDVARAFANGDAAR